jgi:hypothetical protein
MEPIQQDPEVTLGAEDQSPRYWQQRSRHYLWARLALAAPVLLVLAVLELVRGQVLSGLLVAVGGVVVGAVTLGLHRYYRRPAG